MFTWQCCGLRQGLPVSSGCGGKDQLLLEIVIPSSHPAWKEGPESMGQGGQGTGRFGVKKGLGVHL